MCLWFRKRGPHMSLKLNVTLLYTHCTARTLCETASTCQSPQNRLPGPPEGPACPLSMDHQPYTRPYTRPLEPGTPRWAVAVGPLLLVCVYSHEQCGGCLTALLPWCPSLPPALRAVGAACREVGAALRAVGAALRAVGAALRALKSPYWPFRLETREPHIINKTTCVCVCVCSLSPLIAFKLFYIINSCPRTTDVN